MTVSFGRCEVWVMVRGGGRGVFLPGAINKKTVLVDKYDVKIINSAS